MSRSVGLRILQTTVIIATGRSRRSDPVSVPGLQPDTSIPMVGTPMLIRETTRASPLLLLPCLFLPVTPFFVVSTTLVFNFDPNHAKVHESPSKMESHNTRRVTPIVSLRARLSQRIPSPQTLTHHSPHICTFSPPLRTATHHYRYKRNILSHLYTSSPWTNLQTILTTQQRETHKPRLSAEPITTHNTHDHTV